MKFYFSVIKKGVCVMDFLINALIYIVLSIYVTPVTLNNDYKYNLRCI